MILSGEKGTFPWEARWPPKNLKLVSGKAGLVLRFAGPDAALGLGGRAAPEAVV